MKTRDWHDLCPVTRKHHQKTFLWQGERVWVDEKLINLIPNLFKLGIITTSSCQSSCGGWCNRKHKLVSSRRRWHARRRKWITSQVFREPKLCRESIWLVFYMAEDAQKFMNTVYRADDPERLRHHMQGIGRKQSHAWTWKTRLTDFNDRRCKDSRGYWIGQVDGPPDFDFFATVVFPRAHFDLVCRRVQEAVDKKGKR